VSKLPKKTTYLAPKGGRFYFRVRIPDELREHFGKKEHWEALRKMRSRWTDMSPS
jgi:hypothetical protein